jgi:hypothetical protein
MANHSIIRITRVNTIKQRWWGRKADTPCRSFQICKSRRTFVSSWHSSSIFEIVQAANNIEALAVACRDVDVRNVKAIIIGPPDTPYEFGFFEVCPTL